MVDFVGIGPPRTATTWLFENLESHPDIGIPAKKSINFFNEYYEFGVDWYVNSFHSVEKNQCIGELSPLYYGKPEIPGRIANHYPGTKMIMVARDPIARLESHCKLVNSLKGTNSTLSHVWNSNHYLLECGFYNKYLELYLQHFDRNQILVLAYPEIASNPDSVIKQTLEFLGVGTDYKPPKKDTRVGFSIVPKYPMVEKLRQIAYRSLYKAGLSKLILKIKQTGLSDRLRKFNSGDKVSRFSDSEKIELREIYREDFSAFQNALGVCVAEETYMIETDNSLRSSRSG